MAASATVESPPPGDRTCQPALLLLLRLCLSLAAVATACAECAAACVGLAGCSTIARHLLAAGLAVLIGCSPLAASHVADVLSLGESAAARRLRARARLRLAEADDAFEEPPMARPPKGAAVVSADDASSDFDDNQTSELQPDLKKWITEQKAASDVQLIKNDDQGHSLAFVLGRFVSGIRQFYRPGASPEDREHRQLICLLICLPVSCAYALPLYQLLYSAQEPLPHGCTTGRAAPLLQFFARFAVFTRGGACGAALLVCLTASGMNLVRRHLHRSRTAERLRLEKPRLFTRLFS